MTHPDFVHQQRWHDAAAGWFAIARGGSASKKQEAAATALGNIVAGDCQAEVREIVRLEEAIATAEAQQPERDAQIPTGTVIPGLIVTGPRTGDRADIRGAARWLAGRWSLEAARRLDTHSPYDVPIVTGIFLRVAAFDRSQIRHTRHVRPIRIEVE